MWGKQESARREKNREAGKQLKTNEFGGLAPQTTIGYLTAQVLDFLKGLSNKFTISCKARAPPPIWGH